MDELHVAAFYKFAAFPDYREWQTPLLELCEREGLHGTLLLAPEGLNGTIAGCKAGISALHEFLRRDERFSEFDCKWSTAATPPFARMKVRLKKEIVTMGVPSIDPNQSVGTYVEPQDWNQLLEDPDVILVDTRNQYEVAIGTFKGAVNPKLDSFREFPDWLRQEFNARTNPKVAMFCTGGIRCEKSTAFLKQEGVSEVFHLKGGILKYLETVEEESSLWEGECYVFDERVSVGHGLRPGSYELCRACGDPINAADKMSSDFALGVSCPHCIDRSTPEQKERFTERVRQVEIAKSRGKTHLKARPSVKSSSTTSETTET
ncbi:MAG: UPF0176 protein [Planctomycetota bacterium]|jgi:UPF0176 protein